MAASYLARYAATAAGVRRVLHRRIDRWAARTDEDRAEAAAAVQEAKRVAVEIVAGLVQAGAINDATFAESRARSLTRTGRSVRSIAGHLLSRGVDANVVAASRPADSDERAAALALCRRRRIGPFRAGAADEDTLRRETGVLARAGFPRDVATDALGTAREAAELLVSRLRSS